MSGPIERGASSGPLDPSGEFVRSDSSAAHFGAARRREEEAEKEEEPFVGHEAAAVGSSGVELRRRW